MPNFDSNDPSSFGWTSGPADIVPFIYAGHEFYSGVSRLLLPIFTRALDILCAQPGFELHRGSGINDGMWGYEDRNLTNGVMKSFHAYGLAIDINAPWNPYGSAAPPASPWRLPMSTYELMVPLGLLWGGSERFGSHRDWMHLESHNTPTEAQALAGRPAPGPRAPGGAGFPLPGGCYYGPYSGPAESISGSGASDAPYRSGLAAAQRKLGVTADGFYGPATAAATASFQRAHGLVADSLIGPKTWAALMR